VDSYKAKHTTIDQLCADVKRLATKWGVTRFEVDAAALGKYIVDEVRRRTGLPLQAAEKRNKLSYQELVRTDLQAGRIKALPAAKVLVDEWKELQYDDDGQEPAKADNHCSDAFLYIYRWARNYFAKEQTDLEAEETIEDKMLRKLQEKARRARVGTLSTTTNMATALRGIL
jgi:hypothetical protein